MWPLAIEIHVLEPGDVGLCLSHTLLALGSLVAPLSKHIQWLQVGSPASAIMRYLQHEIGKFYPSGYLFFPRKIVHVYPTTIADKRKAHYLFIKTI